MPLPYSILIELDLGFNVGAGQDVPLPRPGEIISAGFTEFNGYQTDKYLIVEEERGAHTVRTLRTQDQDTFDYWDGTDFITVTQSKEEIKERKDKKRKEAKRIQDGDPVDTTGFIKSLGIVTSENGVAEPTFLNDNYDLVFNEIEIDSVQYSVPMYRRKP